MNKDLIYCATFYFVQHGFLGFYSFNQILSQAKIFLYLTWTAGIEEDTQRSGLVYLLWFDSTLDVSFEMERYKLAAKLKELVTVRTCSVHICAPPKPIFQWGLYVMTFQISRKNRAKVTVHLGMYRRS